MKKRLAVFPFSKKLNSLILNKDQLQNYELVYAIIPRGWDDLEEIQAQYKEIIIDEEPFFINQYISNVDAILLCKPILDVNDSLYTNIINLAKGFGVKIIYDQRLTTLPVEKDQKNWECLELHGVFEINNHEFLNIDVPVISVFGLGENCEKWDVQLELCDFFNKKGYKVSLISNNPLLQLFGGSVFPPIIDSTEYTFEQQVKSINSFIKNVELRERPDLIIIDVPGAILKYNRYIPNGYGYAPFLISNAVVPDLSIISLYCGCYDKEHIEEIKKSCLYRMGTSVNYFHLSSNVCQYNLEANRLEYFSIDNDYVAELVEKNKINGAFFNIHDMCKREQIFQQMLNELHNNIPIM
jgi:peptide maturation system protein (TIGR04066 family)